MAIGQGKKSALLFNFPGKKMPMAGNETQLSPADYLKRRAGTPGEMVLAKMNEIFKFKSSERTGTLATLIGFACMEEAGLKGADFKEVGGGMRALPYEKYAKFMKVVDAYFMKVEKYARQDTEDFFEALLKNNQKMEFGGALTSLVAAFPNGQKYARYVIALSGCEGVKSQKTMEGKVREIRERIKVLEELGIEFVGRFQPEALESTYLVATGKADMSRKLAIIVMPKADWNGSLYSGSGLYQSLLDNGYNVLICEAGTDGELAERFFNYGRREKNAAKNFHFHPGKADHTRYALAVFAGHGTPETLSLGTNQATFGPATLDVEDEFMLRKYGNWKEMLTEKAPVCLWACSTGADWHMLMPDVGGLIEMFGKAVPYIIISPNAFLLGVANQMVSKNNLMRKMGDITGAETFAPGEPTYDKAFEFEGGNVIGIKYYGKKGEDITRSYRPKKK